MKKPRKILITPNTIFLLILFSFLIFTKSHVKAYNDPFIGNIDIVSYSFDGLYPNFNDVDRSKSFYDVSFDPSQTKTGNFYMKVIQKGSGGNRNIVVDNDDGNFVDAKYSDISTDLLTYGGMLTGYSEIFEITDLKPGYHNIKRLGFNNNMHGKPIVQDSIRVRVSEFKKFPSINNVPINKTFLIKFSKPLKIDSSIKDFVKVLDPYGNEIPVNIKFGSDQKSLEIYAPDNNYSSNSSYTLEISPDVKSSNNKELFTLIKMDFTTSNDSRSLSSRSLSSKSLNILEKTPDLMIDFN